jgi:hypothetical protein
MFLKRLENGVIACSFFFSHKSYELTNLWNNNMFQFMEKELRDLKKMSLDLVLVVILYIR